MAVLVVLFTAYFVFAFASPSHQIGATYTLSTSSCSIYNFGDSNSDTGSDSATFGRRSPPNGQTFFKKASSRYSDGRLIIDFIAEKLGLPYLVGYLDSIGADFVQGANFAASGATIQDQDTKLCVAGFNPITLSVQVSQYDQFKARTIESYGKGSLSKTALPKPESFARALFTIDIGQNDLHSGLTTMKEEQVVASIPQIIDHFSESLKKLYKLGARAFWIHNTGPIGCLPFFVLQHHSEPNNTDPNGCIKSHNEVAQEFNKQLKNKISRLQRQFNNATLVYVDIYSAKYGLISQGKDQGFPNRVNYCCGKPGVFECGDKVMVNGTQVYGKACSNPQEYISWDSVHYTEAANKWVANHILDGSFSNPKLPITQLCHKSS